MQRLTHFITVIARVMTGLSFLVIIAAVLIQLAGRSGLIPSVVWTEELTRFALLYLAAWGVGLSYRSGNLVNVDIISEALPPKVSWALRFFCAVITAGFGIVLINATMLYISVGARQTAPSLGIRMDYVYSSVLVALLALSLFGALRVFGMLTGTTSGTPERSEEEY